MGNRIMSGFVEKMTSKMILRTITSKMILRKELSTCTLFLFHIYLHPDHRYFCTSVEKPEGDVDLLLESMKAMNAKSDPSEEERKGGAGHIGKILSHNYPVSWTT